MMNRKLLIGVVALAFVVGATFVSKARPAGSGAKDGRKITLVAFPPTMPAGGAGPTGGVITLTATLTLGDGSAPPNAPVILVYFSGASFGGCQNGVATQTCIRTKSGTYKFTAAAPDFGVSNEVTVVVGDGGGDSPPGEFPPGGGDGDVPPGRGTPKIMFKADPSAVSEGEAVTLTATLRQADRSLAPPGTPVTILRDGAVITDPPLFTGDGPSTGKASKSDVPFPTGSTETIRKYDANSPDYNPGHATVTKLPPQSLNVEDKLWRRRKDDQTQDPGTYKTGDTATPPLIVGPKSIGADADQLAQIRFNITSPVGGHHYLWAVRATSDSSVMSSGTGPSGSLLTLVAGSYYVEMWESESPLYRRVNIVVPKVDIEALVLNGNPVIEKDEEKPGAVLSSQGTKIVAHAAGLSGYGRSMAWTNPSKVEVRDVANGIAGNTIYTSPITLTEGDGDKQFIVIPNSGFTATDSIDVKLTVKSGDASASFDDTAKLTSGTIDVVEMPEYLFANATFATPITFKVAGFGGQGKYWIKSVSVKTSTWSSSAGETVTTLFSTASRFTPTGATSNKKPDGSPNNGTTDTYTCFMPSSTYGTLAFADHVTSSARFQLEVLFVVGEQDSTNTVMASSDLNDKDAAPKKFADGAIIAYDIRNVNRWTTLPVQDRFAGFNAVPTGVDKASQMVTTHYRGTPVDEVDGLYGNPTGYCWDGCWLAGGGLPHDHANFQAGRISPPQNYEAECWSAIDPLSGLSRLYIRQKIGEFNNPAGEQCYRLSNFGRRLGVAFYISYGGRVVSLNGVNEAVMDLTVKSGTIDLFMFQGGWGSINLKSSNNPVGFALASAATSVMWALASGFTSQTFGVISSIYAAVAANDGSTGVGPDDTADGNVSSYRVKLSASGGSSLRTMLPGHTVTRVVNNSAAAALDCNDNYAGAAVGEQFAYFVELNAFTTGRNRSYDLITSRAELKAEVIYESTLPGGSAVQLNDLSTYLIDLR